MTSDIRRNPKVSFIIPISRQSDPDDLCRLLKSISNQTYKDTEIIVVPDIEGTVKVPRDDIRLLAPAPKAGASFARNYAAKQAHGDFLAFLDDDVVLDERWCEYVVETLADPSIAAVTGKAVVSRKDLEWVPTQLKWVIGACYWDHKTTTDVYGAAGMNFCLRRDTFFVLSGYDPRLGPRGDRPEEFSWRRLGGEESDLALRIIINAKKRVVYNPRMIVAHRLRKASLSFRGLIKRSLHVGHNRAYIHARFLDRPRGYSDEMVLKNLVKELLSSLRLLPSDPLYFWKRFSFTAIVVSSTLVGFVIGKIDFKKSASRLGF